MPALDETAAEQQFLEACPSFRPVLQRMRAEWLEVGDAPSLFNVLDALGRHWVDLLARGQTAEIQRGLETVECMLKTGNQAVVGATTLGLLTALQVEAKQRGLYPEVFTAELGSQTWDWWNDLTKNWEGARDW
jgi:hypothetical protein